VEKDLNSLIRRLRWALAKRVAWRLLAPQKRRLIAQLRKERLTYLSELRLIGLMKAVERIERERLSGIIIEAGCALGGSSILMASLKLPTRYMEVYDVFERIPAPTQEDPEEVHKQYQKIANGSAMGIAGDVYYGYLENLYEIVKSNFWKCGIDLEQNKVTLIKGLLQNTLQIEQPVALAHIDVDWYEPVKICLQEIAPHLVIGGSIILDDYYDWGGCRKATDEYLETTKGQFVYNGFYSSMQLTRVKSQS